MADIHFVEYTPVITAGAYSDNDVIGELMTFQSRVPAGVIRHITVIDRINLKAAINFHIYNAVPTVIADNAAFAPADADSDLEICKAIKLLTTDYISNGTLNATGQVRPNQGFAVNDGKLYVRMVLPTGVTYTGTSNLLVKFEIWPY
jgi:hypothetical protein